MPFSKVSEYPHKQTTLKKKYVPVRNYNSLILSLTIDDFNR